MLPFPPIFAYTIFFILDFIAFIFDITVVASIVGVFISFLSTFLYILWVFFRYGPGKATEKLFNLKQKTAKKLMKLFGGATIPFVNVWAVYDDYKEEKKEFRNKELGITEDDSQNKGSGLFKKLLIGGAIVATGGAAAGALAGEAAVAGEAAAVEGGAATTAGEAAAIGREAKVIEGNFASNVGREAGKKVSKKTVEEEIGGVKTGLNREDYDSQIKNYGDFNTYAQENKEKEEEKRNQEAEKRKNDEAKRIQGLKVEKDLREEILDRSKRRFGENSDQVKRMKEEVGD